MKKTAANVFRWFGDKAYRLSGHVADASLWLYSKARKLEPRPDSGYVTSNVVTAESLHMILRRDSFSTVRQDRARQMADNKAMSDHIKAMDNGTRSHS
jgi:hypothetical protein